MLKCINLEEIKTIPEPEIREYILNKATELMDEYGVNNLDDIGCFVVLDSSENKMFSVSEMEFVEVLNIGEKHYLHGVKILSDWTIVKKVDREIKKSLQIEQETEDY